MNRSPIWGLGTDPQEVRTVKRILPSDPYRRAAGVAALFAPASLVPVCESCRCADSLLGPVVVDGLAFVVCPRCAGGAR